MGDAATPAAAISEALDEADENLILDWYCEGCGLALLHHPCASYRSPGLADILATGHLDCGDAIRRINLPLGQWKRERVKACGHHNIRYCRVPDCEKHYDWYCEDCDQPVSWALAIERGFATPGSIPDGEA